MLRLCFFTNDNPEVTGDVDGQIVPCFKASLMYVFTGSSSRRDKETKRPFRKGNPFLDINGEIAIPVRKDLKQLGLTEDVQEVMRNHCPHENGLLKGSPFSPEGDSDS